MKAYGEGRYTSTHSQAWDLFVSCCQLHVPVLYSWQTRPRHPLARRLGKPQGRSGSFHGEENIAGNRTASHPVSRPLPSECWKFCSSLKMNNLGKGYDYKGSIWATCLSWRSKMSGDLAAGTSWTLSLDRWLWARRSATDRSTKALQRNFKWEIRRQKFPRL
jgi:hypothetical protein